MISDQQLVALHYKGSPTQGQPISRKQADNWLRSGSGSKGGWEIVSVPSCLCCGAPAWSNRRCTKHQDRNPCFLDGCKRTRMARGRLSTEVWICGEHWKRFVPARSPERRAYNRFFQIAKKLGVGKSGRWPFQLEARYWRFWRGLVKRVRRQAVEGRLDQAEIESMFGWDDKPL